MIQNRVFLRSNDNTETTHKANISKEHPPLFFSTNNKYLRKIPINRKRNAESQCEKTNQYKTNEKTKLEDE